MESRTHKELLKIGLVELGVIKLWASFWFKLWFQSFYYKKEWCSLLFKLSLPTFLVTLLMLGIVIFFGRCVCNWNRQALALAQAIVIAPTRIN